MMQRSDLLLVAIVLAGGGAAYALGGEVPALVVATAAVLGGGVALLAGGLRRADRPARVRKAARATLVAPRAAAVSTVPTRAPARLAMERGSASASQRPALRLTHDILAGMHTGGKTTRGLCSSCGATLWLSARRPLKARCPVCGHTRVLE